MNEKKIRVPDIARFRQRKEKIVAITAYDYTMAKLIDMAGVDIILVGDSLGTVLQGYENTLKVTMDQMIYHTSMVARAVEKALVVADMPFMSYQVAPEQALENAGQLIQEGGAEAVKLEGGSFIAPTVELLSMSGIPVMGHLGLTPQSFHSMGGHRIQGRLQEEAKELEESALELEDAGAFAIVLEGMPQELATRITKSVAIPTIGIGAGASCSGQVLVINDVLGLSHALPPSFPKFVKNYTNISEVISTAVSTYSHEVKTGAFPEEKHSYSSSGPRLVKTRTD